MKGLVVAAVALAVGLANLAKPVHIDDALYVSVARRILTHPLDPYGGELNWQQIPEPTYKSSISPPLLSYYFAAVMLLAGDHPRLLHAAMIPWLLLLAWSTMRLGDRLAAAGFEAALLVLVGPAVVVGTNLMLDVPMLACATTSVVFALRAEEDPRAWRNWIAAGLAASAACLTKYPAVAVLGVLLVIAVRSKRWASCISLLAPIAVLAAWQLWSRSLYGSSQVQQSLGFLSQFGEAAIRRHLARTLNALAILGLTCPVWWTAAFVGRRRLLNLVLGGVGSTTAWFLLQSDPGRSLYVNATFCVGVLLGTFGVAEALAALAQPRALEGDRRRGDGLLLVVWTAGFAAVAILFGPFVAVRSFLPLQPALWLLLLRAAEPGRRRTLGVWTAGGLSAALSAMLAWADVRWANVYPQSVGELAKRFGDSRRPIYFLGHWGWQYYAEREGFHAWDARWTSSPGGGIVVIPQRADKQIIRLMDSASVRQVDKLVFPPHPWRWTTWNRGRGIRFYGGDFGEIPYGFSSEPTEQFLVIEQIASP